MERKRKRQPTYTAEFRAEAVRVARESERPLKALAKELDISSASLYRWCRDAEGVSTPEVREHLAAADEVQHLRRELERVRQERDFLKKAAAFFANDKSDGSK